MVLERGFVTFVETRQLVCRTWQEDTPVDVDAFGRSVSAINNRVDISKALL